MRERSSRDAKKSSRGTAVEAWRIEDCERSDSNVNLYLSVTSLTNTTSVKMAGLLGKKFPTPVGTFNALRDLNPTLESCLNADSFAIARPMAPFYIAGSFPS